MFLDIAPSEFLLTAAVAIVVIGPKDMPRALRMAGRWIGKMRRISGHFRAGIETMIREAEMEEMEKTWREQNEAIMRATPSIAPAVSAGEAATAEAAEVQAGGAQAALPAPVDPVLAPHAPSEPYAPGASVAEQGGAQHVDTGHATGDGRPHAF